MVEAYLFDWGRTLGDVILTDGARELGENRELFYQLITRRFEDVDIPDDQADLIRSAMLDNEGFLYDDSFEVVHGLKQEGKKLAIVSDMFDLTSQQIVREFPDLMNLFDILTWSCYMGTRKPDPLMFTYTCDQLNVNLEQAMMIGDADRDVEPARKLGMQARKIDRSYQGLRDVL